MKLPGKAWLQFEVRKTGADTTQLEQTAVFSPRGLTGLVYWYALYPFHAWIFRGLIRAIARGGRSGSRKLTPAPLPDAMSQGVSVPARWLQPSPARGR